MQTSSTQDQQTMTGWINKVYPACAYPVRCVQENPNEKMIPVTSLTLDRTTLDIAVETTYTLTAEILPADATHKTVYWLTDNKRIATVDENGKVTAIREGTATITAMAGMIVAQCVVNVGQ